MRLIFTCLLFTLVHLFSIAQQAWVPLGLPSSERYDDVFFLNQNHGFTINAEGEFYYTNDAGKNWELRSSFNQYLRCVEFIDQNHGFIGTLDSAFYETSDGGYTWHKINQKLNSPNPIPGICALSIIGQTIYAGGKWSSNSGYVFKSSNSGQTWQFIDLKKYASGIVELQFHHPDTGFAAGIGPTPQRGSVILKTTDGGQTWKEVYGSNDGYSYAWKIQQLSNSKLVASIQRVVQLPMIMLMSTDAGETWVEKEVDPIPSTYAQTIGFFNDSIGFTGGGSQIYQTNDGGENWIKIPLLQRCNRFFQTSDSTGFMSGNTLYRWGNEKAFSVEQPNQFISKATLKAETVNQSIKIQFYIPHKSHIHLALFSINGQFERPILNSFFTKGSHELQYDLSTIATGVYLLVMHTNYGLKSIKIVL